MTSTRATTSECATTSDKSSAQSFVRALRAYHGTLAPRWGPTSDQCAIVRARAARLPWNARPPVGLSPTSSGSVPAPSSRPIQERAASCSSPPAQPPRCGAVARSEKINLALGPEKYFSVTRRLVSSLGNSSQLSEKAAPRRRSSPLLSTVPHITSHRRRDQHRCPRRNPRLTNRRPLA